MISQEGFVGATIDDDNVLGILKNTNSTVLARDYYCRQYSTSILITPPPLLCLGWVANNSYYCAYGIPEELREYDS